MKDLESQLQTIDPKLVRTLKNQFQIQIHSSLRLGSGPGKTWIQIKVQMRTKVEDQFQILMLT